MEVYVCNLCMLVSIVSDDAIVSTLLLYNALYPYTYTTLVCRFNEAAKKIKIMNFIIILYIHTLRTAAAMGDCPRGTPHYSRWGSLPGNSHNMYCELVLFPFNTALCNYIAIIYLLCGREQSLGYPPNKVGQLDNAGDLRLYCRF